MNFPPDLLASINCGRCFALIGSGPSAELGYPSWQRLAEAVLSFLQSQGTAIDQAAYQACLDKKQYAELLAQAEFDVGGRRKLVDILKALLVPKYGRPGPIYDFLTRWPFACYLTTNYDDEISAHLQRIGTHFQTLLNTVDDLRKIRADANHLIIKLHSDLQHPVDAIITSADYKTFGTDIAGDHFRTKLRSILEMFDTVIIGHSLSDPDIRLVLQQAQETANPARPIYLIATGLSTIDVREYYQNFNIIAIPYDNADGTHERLRRLLSTANKFVQSRHEQTSFPAYIDAREAEAATSIFIFRRLMALSAATVKSSTEYLGPVIVNTLLRHHDIRDIGSLIDLKPLSSIADVAGTEALTNSLEDSLRDLTAGGMLEKNWPLNLTPKGREQALEVSGTRDLERQQAYGQFSITFRHRFPEIQAADDVLARELLEQCILEAFKKRGLSMANYIFGDQSASPDDLSSLFGTISQAASHLSSSDSAGAFIEAAHEFLLSPTAPQRSYLASVAQGFFLYHMLGFDATCARIREDLFSSTIWFCDSSILIPLLAKGSQNHHYASDLFHKLKSRGVQVYVTRKMGREVWGHLDFAIKFIRENGSITPAFLALALGKPGYKPNLFIDGFIRMAADGEIGTFDEYVHKIVDDTRESAVLDRLKQGGVLVTDIALLPGFRARDMDEVRHTADLIKEDRSAHLIYRSDEQVLAEAEVLYIIRQHRKGSYAVGSSIRAYFISQSHVLNRVAQEEHVTTWTPEAVYQYLTSLPNEVADPALLQECMLTEYYDAGVSIIDKERYLKFFGPTINASRLRYDEEKNGYLKDVEKAAGRQSIAALDRAFAATPDLEKPLFVHRMNFRSVEAADAAAKEAYQRAQNAERRVKQLEEERAKKWRSTEKRRAQQVEAEERNRLDPKHVRKRMRQKKQRLKGK